MYGSIFDTAALALARTGSLGSAVAAQREAISLVPADSASQAFIPEMRERLDRYEAERAD